MNKIVLDIEVALSRHINLRQNLLVPNVSWGLGLHECDVLALSRSGYLTEYEIKTSAADLKKDRTKVHGHYSDRIKYLYFVVPSKLARYCEYVPERAGIIVVNSHGQAFEIARAHANPRARALTDKERYDYARLGAMRIWGLKIENLGLKRRNAVLEKETKLLEV